jgi:hypothetical protein
MEGEGAAMSLPPSVAPIGERRAFEDDRRAAAIVEDEGLVGGVVGETVVVKSGLGECFGECWKGRVFAEQAVCDQLSRILCEDKSDGGGGRHQDKSGG